MNWNMLHRTRKIVLANLILMVSGILPVTATMYYVATNGTHTAPYDSWVKAATNIQTAIDAAGAGDIVAVGDGQYIVTQRVTIEKGITVRGFSGPADVEVNGNNTTGCFSVCHTDAVLEGFTITAGSSARGGGVSITNGLVHNCVVTGNYASLFGGGVDIYDGGVVSNCVISHNQTPFDASGSGGGVCCSGVGMLLNSTVNGNEAGAGGGVYTFASAVVSDCTISSNLSWETVGGGVGSGGGVECNGTNITIRNCQIMQNNAQESGGGVYLSGHADQKVIGCLIYDNETDWFGGGVYANTAPSAYAIENCTIVENRATNLLWGIGGGVCSGSGQALSLRNCIVYSNTAAFTGANFYGLDSGPISGQHTCTTPALSGTNNITADPLFGNANIGNFRLSTGSPCIDTGTNQNWMITAKDLDGKSRILNNTVDMGAYEYGIDPTISNNLAVSILLPQAGDTYNAINAILFSGRAVASGQTVVTQTVAYADDTAIRTDVWTNEQYCVVYFLWTNVSVGAYTLRLEAWDNQGTVVTSDTVSIAVEGQPAIAEQPESRTAGVGEDVTFSVQATNAIVQVQALSYYYQWHKDNVSVADKTSATYTITSVTTNDAGDFHCVVSNSVGSVTSSVATLIVGVFNGAGAGDVDGDGLADPAAYLSANGWYFWLSANNYVKAGPYFQGSYNVQALLDDFDGDGKADPTLCSETNGWYVWFSANNYAMGGPYLTG